MDIRNYNVIWDSPSENCADSMPVGGYDTGCNVWVENGVLYLYVSESGAFDENNTLLKLTRLRLWTENLGSMAERGFCQELHLEDGSLQVQAGSGEDSIRFLIWASVSKPEIHIEIDMDQPREFFASLDCWRSHRREVVREERGQCRDYDYKIGKYSGKVFTEPDTVEPAGNRLCFWHRNKERTVWDDLISQQHLEAIQEEIPNPLKKRTMGGMLSLPGMVYLGTQGGVYANTDYTGYLYHTDKAAGHLHLILTLLTACTDSLEEWKRQLEERAAIFVSRTESSKWWQDYFAKSYIFINEDRPDTVMYRIGRNYQLFRYMLGCNYYGEYPTKFNGGLFTFDESFTPDYRMWSGGGFTLQNQRLVYWPMLKSGDFEGMLPQFEYFRRTLKAGKAKTRHFFGHEGAYFHEQGNLFGICIGAEYNWEHRPELSEGLEDGAWVRLHFSDSLEFALMMLEYARYTGKRLPEDLDFIENVVEFYFHHYPRDDEGRLRIFPASALETYKGKDPYSANDEEYGCENPMDAVSGLRCVLSELIRYFMEENNGEKAAYYERYLDICPELPIGKNEKNETVFLPAAVYDPKPFNCELPELYLIYPYSPDGLSDEEKRIGRNTYNQPYAVKEMYLGYSWHQNGIFAARLELKEEAMRYLREKLDDGPRRFPAFWGPGHDWTPDHNHGGSGMIQLQEMLVQCETGKLRILPCWEEDCDVSFRLFAPGRRIVEGQWENHTMRKLKIYEAEE